jgi:hypothetical protein
MQYAYDGVMSSSEILEIRTYVAAPGKLPYLKRRFAEHTLGLFERHGLRLDSFWAQLDADGNETDTLVYTLRFDSVDQASTAWNAFKTDPDWVAAYRASESDGPLTSSITSVFVTPVQL